MSKNRCVGEPKRDAGFDDISVAELPAEALATIAAMRRVAPVPNAQFWEQCGKQLVILIDL